MNDPVERRHAPDAAGARLIEAVRAHLPHLMAKHGTIGLNIALADGGRLIWEATAAAMLSPATELARTEAERATLGDFDGEQGLVWRLNDVGKPWTSFDHGGGHMFGWRTQGRAWPAYRAVVMVASNQWSLPDDTGEVQEIADFVGTWLRYRAPAGLAKPSRPPYRDLSYTRGVLAAAAYRVFCGIPGDVPAGALDAAIAGTRDRGGGWDAIAFRRGFLVASALPPTVAAIKDFWNTPACEVGADAAWAAHHASGGRHPGMLSSILPERGNKN